MLLAPVLASISDVADLIRAVSTLLWPFVAVAFFVIFREPIESLLKRLTRARVLGQEAEFGHDLDRLNAHAREAAATIPERTPDDASERGRSLDEEIGELLREAATSPKVALMALSAELEARTRRLAAATGWARGERSAPRMLRRMPGIPDVLGDAIDEFWRARNRIVHGHSATDAEALRAIDAGITIIRTLDRMAPQPSVVEEPRIPLFADPDGRSPRHDVHGVKLKTLAADGVSSQLQVFPTTRTHFVRGMEVAWEWGSKTWSETWYHDAEAGEMRRAWDQSAEFVGRDLADV